MPSTIYKPLLGSGQVYARTAGAAAGLLAIGNVSVLELEQSEDKKTLKDYTKPGGGTYASVTRIENVTAKLTVHDLNKTNLARAAFGDSATVPTGTETNEEIIGYKAALVPLAHIGISDVTLTNAGATTTYLLGTDYEVRGGGLFILEAGAITNGQDLLVDYTYAAYDRIEGVTQSGVVLELYFDGINEADSGKPVIINIYRGQLSPAKALSLLGDDFAELEMEMEVLKDPSKTGVGISQYYSIRFV
ncbi:MAG: hypothetical protein ACKVOO_12420 [Burkholderiaceae bacterium]